MSKKMFDILPPKIARKIEDGIKSLAGEPRKKEHQKKRRDKNKTSFLRWILIAAVVALLVLAGFLYFKLQKVDVEIWPTTQTLSFKDAITADKNASSIDSTAKVIPVQYLEEEKDSWQEFPATGTASNGAKARGKIKIYNKYNPATVINLKTGTHFLSDSNKYFVTLKKITVPAASYKSGKLVPGSIEADVEAAEAGDSYNIGPAKFSVPKLAGTAYYYSIYAESTGKMSGGFEDQVKKVTDDDIKTAKSALTEKLLNDAEASLRERISEDDILLGSAISKKVLENSADVKSGAVVEKFNYQAKVMVAALVFKKQDLEKFAKDYIISQMPESKTILDKSFTLNYSFKSIDMDAKKVVVDIDFSAKIYQTVDENDLISAFRDKSASEIKEKIDEIIQGNISEVKVNFWPFWTNKAPRDKDKIKIDLKFE